MNALLALPHEFSKVPVPAGERVTLDRDGQLLEYSRQLATDQVVGRLHCSAERRIWLYPSGHPSSVVLAAPSLIGGQEYARGSELFLEEDGDVLEFNVVDLDSGRKYKQRVFGVYEAPIV